VDRGAGANATIAMTTHSLHSGETPAEQVDAIAARLNAAPRPKRTIDAAGMLSPAEWERLDTCMEELGPDAVLDRLSPLFAAWQEKYDGLLALLQRHGYETLLPTDLPPCGVRCCVLYHDVHAWDVLAAMALTRVNRARDVRSTFFLNWDFSLFDVPLRPSYRVFRHLAGRHVEVGMHTGIFSSWLRFVVFGGDERRFDEWARDDESVDREIVAILDDSATGPVGRHSLSDVLEGMHAHLADKLAAFRQVFPLVRAINHHGDEVARRLALTNPHIPDALKRQLAASSSEFYTPERLRALGLEANLWNVHLGHAGSVRFPEGKNRRTYFQNLDALLAEGKPVYIINHPNNFFFGNIVYDVDFVRRLQGT